MHQVPAAFQQPYEAYLLQPPSGVSLQALLHIVNKARPELKLVTTKDFQTFGKSCYGVCKNTPDIKEPRHIGRIMFSIHVGKISSQGNASKSHAIMVKDPSERCPTWGICLLAANAHEVETTCISVSSTNEETLDLCRAGDDLEGKTVYDLREFFLSPEWQHVLNIFVHFRGGSVRTQSMDVKASKRQCPESQESMIEARYWLPTKLTEALQMASLPSSYSVVLQELYNQYQFPAKSCSFSGLRSLSLKKGASSYSKLAQAALHGQVFKAAEIVQRHNKDRKDFTPTKGQPTFTLPAYLASDWERSDEKIEEFCKQKDLAVHVLHPSVVVPTDFEKTKERLVFDIRIRNLANCIPYSESIYGVVDFDHLTPCADNSDEDSSIDGSQLACHSVVIRWFFESLPEYQGFHIVKRADFKLSVLTLKTPVVLPDRCTGCSVEVGRFTGNGSHVWPTLRARWLDFARWESSAIEEEREKPRKVLPAFMQLFLEEDFAKGLELLKIYLGGPGVSKTSKTLLDLIEADVKGERASMVNTFTTSARRQVSQNLLTPSNPCIRVIGYSHLSTLEKAHTLDGHLSFPEEASRDDSAETRMTDHVANLKDRRLNVEKGNLPPEDQKEMRKNHAKIIEAREQAEDAHTKMRDLVIERCTTIISTLGAIARPGASEKFELTKRFEHVAIDEGSLAQLGNFVEGVLLNPELYDHHCRLSLIGDHLQDSPPSMTSPWGQSRNDMAWLQDQWCASSLFEYLFHRLSMIQENEETEHQWELIKKENMVQLNHSGASQRLGLKSTNFYNALTELIGRPLTLINPRLRAKSESGQRADRVRVLGCFPEYLLNQPTGQLGSSCYDMGAAMASALQALVACRELGSLDEHNSSAHSMLATTTPSVQENAKFTVAVVAAYKAQLEAVSKCFGALEPWLDKCTYKALENVQLVLYSSATAQGCTFTDVVLSWPLKTNNFQRFHLLPQRLCNMVSRQVRDLHVIQFSDYDTRRRAPTGEPSRTAEKKTSTLDRLRSSMTAYGENEEFDVHLQFLNLSEREVLRACDDAYYKMWIASQKTNKAEDFSEELAATVPLQKMSLKTWLQDSLPNHVRWSPETRRLPNGQERCVRVFQNLCREHIHGMAYWPRALDMAVSSMSPSYLYFCANGLASGETWAWEQAMQRADVFCLQVCFELCEELSSLYDYDYVVGFGPHKYVESAAGVRQTQSGGGKRTSLFVLKRQRNSIGSPWKTVLKVYHTTMRWVEAALSRSSRLLIVGGDLNMHIRCQNIWMRMACNEQWCACWEAASTLRPLDLITRPLNLEPRITFITNIVF